MLKKFLRNCKNPEGKFGRLVVGAMNVGHSSFSKWATLCFGLKDGKRSLTLAAEAEVIWRVYSSNFRIALWTG